MFGPLPQRNKPLSMKNNCDKPPTDLNFLTERATVKTEFVLECVRQKLYHRVSRSLWQALLRDHEKAENATKLQEGTMKYV